MKYPKDSFHLAVWALAIVLYGITAWYSTGYHSADEHHQIIAFAEHRLGELPEGHLAWEYSEGIRSSIQPWIALGAMQLQRLSNGDVDPQWTAFILRLISMMFALGAIQAFVSATVHGLRAELHKPYILLSYFLWFLPFLAVRFSSESWSAFLLLAGFAAMLHPQRTERWPWRTGALLALAVVIKPSVAIIAVGVAAWLWAIRKEQATTLLRLPLAGLVIAILSVLLDSLFYDRLVVSPLAYVTMAIGGPPREAFDTLPWYYYPPWIIKYAIPPIGITVLVALGLLILRQPKHLLVWIIVPTLVVLSLVPHKEVRFLYPLAGLVPWLIISALSIAQRFTAFPRSLHRAWLLLCIAANLLGLAVITTQPAGNGNTALLDHLAEGRTVTYLTQADEFWRIQIPPFYRRPLHGDTIVDLTTVTAPFTTDLLIAFDADMSTLELRTGRSFAPLARSSSAWAEELFRWYTWNEGLPVIGLYTVGPESDH